MVSASQTASKLRLALALAKKNGSGARSTIRWSGEDLIGRYFIRLKSNSSSSIGKNDQRRIGVHK
jgi:hypothetical protein